jgi:hypothetical protein
MTSQCQVQKKDLMSLTAIERLHLQTISPGFRGQMFFHGGFAPRPAQPGMDGLQRLAVEDLHGLFPGAQPEALVHRLKGAESKALSNWTWQMPWSLTPAQVTTSGATSGTA